MNQADRNICSAAETAEAQSHRYNREENIPTKWLGTTATWRERRLFDWTYLAHSADRAGIPEIAEQARTRATEYLLR
jgi:hypothetical protein